MPIEGQLVVRIDGVERQVDDAAEIVIALSDEALARIIPVRQLAGTLLLDDGRPASGWFFAEGAESVSTYYSSGIPQLEKFCAAKLVRIGGHGDFHVQRAGSALFFVSPQGVPFVYPLNPHSWPIGLRRVAIRLPAMRRTYSGTIQLADGKPAAGKVIAPESVRSIYLGLMTKTDSQGRFRFDAAPNDGVIYVDRMRPGLDGGLPGWADSLPVTATNRDLTIRLQRTGSVLIKVPTDPPFQPRGVYLDDPDSSHRVGYTNESHTFYAPFVRPGKYQIKCDHPESRYELGGLPEVFVTVTAGKEAVVDLRTADRSSTGKRSPFWTEVVVRHEEKPVSGADCGRIPYEASFTYVADDLPSGVTYRIRVMLHNRVLAERSIVLAEGTNAIEQIEVTTAVPKYDWMH